jgi:hypothetical protein
VGTIVKDKGDFDLRKKKSKTQSKAASGLCSDRKEYLNAFISALATVEIEVTI